MFFRKHFHLVFFFCFVFFLVPVEVVGDLDKSPPRIEDFNRSLNVVFSMNFNDNIDQHNLYSRHLVMY